MTKKSGAPYQEVIVQFHGTIKCISMMFHFSLMAVSFFLYNYQYTTEESIKQAFQNL